MGGGGGGARHRARAALHPPYPPRRPSLRRRPSRPQCRHPLPPSRAPTLAASCRMPSVGPRVPKKVRRGPPTPVGPVSWPPHSHAQPLGEQGSLMLSLVLPKGSLERATLELFDAADLTVRRSSDRDYHASIDDPRIDKVRFLRPQEIPSYIERGLFDLGITGRDWIAETNADVVS